MTVVSSLEGHRLWAPFYDTGLNPLVALERRSMRAALNTMRPATMIDVACGTGAWLARFQEAGTSVWGVDSCAAMLEQGLKQPSLRGRLVAGDSAALPFRSDAADLVLCSMALDYFNDLATTFREFARVCVAGGCIAVSDLHPDAIATGWRRSFRLGSAQYEMEHHRRSLSQVMEAATRADLRAKNFTTVFFDEPEYPIFHAAGKEHLFPTVEVVPALFIGIWEKPC